MPFTHHYSQPDEYHFSLDSILLAEKVAKILATRNDLESLSVLDLCSGCGVVGFELMWHLPQLRHVEFVEVQEIYREHFNKNQALVDRPEVKNLCHFINYEELLQKQWAKRFDIIISNPPYFSVGQGKMSPSNFKNRCRFFIDSSYEKFIQAMFNVLKPKGVAFFLSRSLIEHKLNRFEYLQSLAAEFEIVEEIRGSFLTRLSQKSDELFS